MTLDEYFHKIVNNRPDVKETNMFNRSVEKIKESVKLYFQPLIEAWTKPTVFVEQDPALYEEGYWAFEMYTPDYVCDGEFEPEQHDCIIELNDTTWMETLDQILDVMGKHYGYNIKEQVYYSVTFPLNDPECAGYGRSLNDDVLQQLLLTYPEVYDVKGHIE